MYQVTIKHQTFKGFEPLTTKYFDSALDEARRASAVYRGTVTVMSDAEFVAEFKNGNLVNSCLYTQPRA